MSLQVETSVTVRCIILIKIGVTYWSANPLQRGSGMLQNFLARKVESASFIIRP